MLYWESAAAPTDEEQSKRIKQLERALGRSHLQIEILKDVLRRVSCGQAHSPALLFVAQGGEAKLVAETIGITRLSLYYQPKPHVSRADRNSLDPPISFIGGGNRRFVSR